MTQLSTPSKSPVWTSSCTCFVPVAVIRFGPVYVGSPLAKSYPYAGSQRSRMNAEPATVTGAPEPS